MVVIVDLIVHWRHFTIWAHHARTASRSWVVLATTASGTRGRTRERTFTDVAIKAIVRIVMARAKSRGH